MLNELLCIKINSKLKYKNELLGNRISVSRKKMPLTLYYPENAMRLLNFISFVSDNHAGNNEEMLMYVYFGSIVNQQNPWIPCFKCRNENV